MNAQAPVLLVFGFGFVGEALARRLRPQGWRVIGAAREAGRRAELALSGIEPVDPADAPALAAAAGRARAVLAAAPPDGEGCPALRALAPAIAASGAYPDWIGYLSTTGVYGDRDGGWAFEDGPLAAHSPEGARRVAAERDWLDTARGMGLTAAVFRLPGIYGPGRSAFDRLREGRARRMVKPGHVFSRAHVDDVASGLAASIARPRAGRAYNLCDDEPAPGGDVVAWAARLMGAEPPPEVPYDPAAFPPAARRFYEENRRVANARAKAELGWRPAYPSYREGLAAVLAAGG